MAFALRSICMWTHPYFLCRMKVWGMLAVVAGIGLFACGEKSPSTNESPGTSSQKSAFKEIPGWIGIFQDTLPCKDCKGALTRIEFFKDGKYHKSVAFLGKEPILDHTYGIDGKWKYHPALQLIGLDSLAEHGSFFFRPIGDTVLVGCLGNGEPISGKKYQLHRVSSKVFE